MKKILLFNVLLICLSGSFLLAQDVYTQQPVVSLSIMPDYENWSVNNNNSFSEFSSIISAGLNPFTNTSLGLVTRYASVSGDIPGLSGLSDMQLILRQRLPDANLTFDGGVNIPSGKTKLKTDEFITSRVISQELFGLRTSNFGQGLNGFLGITWLHPLSDVVVIGAGVSYQLKSEYQPLADTSSKYKPSNEITATAGLDIKLSETQTLTGDFTGIFYGSDKVDGKEIFASGNRLIFNAMYKQFFGFNYLAFYLLYRDVALDQPKGVYAVLDNEKITPNQLYIGASFNQRFNAQFSLGYGIFASFYEKTTVYYSGYNLYGASLSPQINFSPAVSVPIYLKYAFGSAKDKTDLTNYELSAGIRLNF